jgi:HK97 family phage portal protein
VGRLQAWVNSGALRAGTQSPIDDYWYEPYPGGGSSSGVRVSADSAKRISAVFACVSIISRNVATLPLKLYQERSDGGKEVASRHPLYDVLYSTPNRFQTSSEFRQMMQGHFELRGNAYAEITPGPRGFADQLIPMHPDRVVVTVDSRGMPVYKYSDPRTNQSRTLVSEEVFHLKGWSDDGITGQSTLALGADVFGVAIAAQDYSARYFANDATPPVYITGANFKDDTARDKFKENLQREQTGRNRHKAAVLPIGLDIKSLDIKASDAQLLEARKYSRIEICSMFGVPPHMIGETDKAATYASVEQFNISFAVQCLLPRLVTWEQAITRDLIIVPKYFPKFSMAALLRGNTAERFAAYKIAIENGWMCQDDVRMLEDMNPIPNGVGAKFWRPLNWAPLEQLENPKQQPDPTADPAKALAMEGRIKLLASCAAEPCVRKEINEVRRLHERCQAKEFRSAVGDFYRKHANFLADRMHLPLDVAKEYCDRNSGWIVDAAESAEIGTQLNFDQLLNQGMQWLGEKAAEVSIQ